MVAVSCAAILVVCILAFRNVFFNFFAGDDFAFLPLLKLSLNKPELVLKQFYSPWMDGNAATFYRPLITNLMALEYRAWGANGLLFRLTNFVCHLITSFILGVIIYRLTKPAQYGIQSGPGNLPWAIGSAALFALYPLHAEVVDWIVGRTDGIATMFSLLSFCVYLWGRQTARFNLVVGSVMFLALALMSKEIAVTLPPLCFLWECFFGQPEIGLDTKFSTLTRALRRTSFLWATLALYFVVRRIALGTFVGGYDNSIFFIADPDRFISWWIHGLRMTIVPLNGYLIGSHDLVSKLWTAFLITSGSLFALATLSNRTERRINLFLLLWGALSLVPVYKIFAIWMGMSGSRYAYLFSAPLCAMLAYGFCSQIWSGRRAIAARTLLAVCCVLNAAVLFTNNEAWAEAGHEMNAIVHSFNDFYTRTPGDPDVLVVGLPPHVKGAGGAFCAIEGMTQTPMISRDTHNCVMLDQLDRTMPFGYQKNWIASHGANIKLLSWNTTNKTLDAVDISPANANLEKSWSGERLAALTNAVGPNTKVSRTVDGQLEIVGSGSLNNPPGVIFDIKNLPCWSTDFVAVTLVNESANGNGPVRKEANLLFKNRLQKDFNLETRWPAPIQNSPKEQKLIFSLRSMPVWAMGTASGGFKVLLPVNSKVLIKEVSIVNPASIMPNLSYADVNTLKGKGTISLSISSPTKTLHYDAQSIKGAKSLALQITRPTTKFEGFNVDPSCKVLLKEVPLPGTAGDFTLKLEDFASPSIYEARLAAKDASGNYVGVSGDHIVVCVRK
jgi:hypothetical protein